MEKLSTHKDGARRAHVVGGEEETDLYATKFVSVTMKAISVVADERFDGLVGIGMSGKNGSLEGAARFLDKLAEDTLSKTGPGRVPHPPRRPKCVDVIYTRIADGAELEWL